MAGSLLLNKIAPMIHLESFDHPERVSSGGEADQFSGGCPEPIEVSVLDRNQA